MSPPVRRHNACQSLIYGLLTFDLAHLGTAVSRQKLPGAIAMRQILPRRWNYLPGRPAGFAACKKVKTMICDGKKGAGQARPKCREKAAGSAEQLHDDLRRLVGDGKSLRTELLLGLQRGELGAFLCHVGVDEIADAAVEGIRQFGDEI